MEIDSVHFFGTLFCCNAARVIAERSTSFTSDAFNLRKFKVVQEVYS